MLYLDSEGLSIEMVKTLQARQVDEAAVTHVVTSLVQTSLQGTDSHGINLFPHYCRAVDAGRINARPNFQLSQSAPGSAVLDADHGFGHHAGSVAMEYAVQFARQNGIAAIGVKNSTHFGAAAYFGLHAAAQDCLGFAFTNADALVKAYGGQAPFFGTNPICFCAPLLDEPPFCLDMATSLVSWNKILNYRNQDEPIPEHWAYDANGQPTTDPQVARSLSPIGDYKGYGLGMMVDILCALLEDGPISKDILPMYDAPIEARRQIGHFFMALDISQFTDVRRFKTRLQDMVQCLRQMPVADGFQQVLAAGDPEKNSVPHRLKTGIPIDETRFAEYLDVSPDFEKVVLT